jgi:predicted nucleic acid-binding protein
VRSSSPRAQGLETPRASAAGHATNSMSVERFTLDTNILVDAVDAREGHKREFAMEIIAAAVRLDCLMALQVVGEFYAAATTRFKLDAKDVAARTAQLIAGFDTFGYSVHAVRAALEEAPKGRFSYWDTVLLAAAAEAGCTTIFSEDMADGARFGSITVANPFRRDGLAPHAKAMLGLE